MGAVGVASWPPSERALVPQGHGDLILLRRPAGVGGDRLTTRDMVYDRRSASHEGHRDLVSPMGAEVGLCRFVLEVEDLRGEASDYAAHEFLHVAAGAAIRLEEEGYEGHAEPRVCRAHGAAPFLELVVPGLLAFFAFGGGVEGAVGSPAVLPTG